MPTLLFFLDPYADSFHFFCFHLKENFSSNCVIFSAKMKVFNLLISFFLSFFCTGVMGLHGKVLVVGGHRDGFCEKL